VIHSEYIIAVVAMRKSIWPKINITKSVHDRVEINDLYVSRALNEPNAGHVTTRVGQKYLLVVKTLNHKTIHCIKFKF